jgi:hypothetical protein
MGLNDICMTYGTFPGPLFDVKSGYEIRIAIYHLWR